MARLLSLHLNYYVSFARPLGLYFNLARPLGLHYNHYVRPSVRGQLVKMLITGRAHYCQLILMLKHKIVILALGGSRGWDRGPDPSPPPENSQKYRVSKQYWSGFPENPQSYQASIQFWAIIGTPAKRHLNGIAIWYLLGSFFPSERNKNKNLVKVWPSLTMLSESALGKTLRNPVAELLWAQSPRTNIRHQHTDKSCRSGLSLSLQPDLPLW